jgi:hypothetical protein
MRKILLAIALIAILAIGSFIYLFRYSPQAQIGRHNVERSKNLYVGMKKVELLQVMGKPKEINYSKYETGKAIYFYQPPFAASDGIEVYLDTANDKVTRIIPYE